MEVLIYISVIMIHLNFFGSGVLVLKILAEEVRTWFYTKVGQSLEK